MKELFIYFCKLCECKKKCNGPSKFVIVLTFLRLLPAGFYMRPNMIDTQIPPNYVVCDNLFGILVVLCASFKWYSSYRSLNHLSQHGCF